MVAVAQQSSETGGNGNKLNIVFYGCRVANGIVNLQKQIKAVLKINKSTSLIDIPLSAQWLKRDL